MRLAIIGGFSKFGSNALNAFIIECNQGGQHLFCEGFRSGGEADGTLSPFKNSTTGQENQMHWEEDR